VSQLSPVGAHNCDTFGVHHTARAAFGSFVPFAALLGRCAQNVVAPLRFTSQRGGKRISR